MVYLDRSCFVTKYSSNKQDYAHSSLKYTQAHKVLLKDTLLLLLQLQYLYKVSCIHPHVMRLQVV